MARDPNVRAWFERTMKVGPDKADGGAFTPLDRFVMELFRTISPNGGSLSSLTRRHQLGVAPASFFASASTMIQESGSL
jgi:hypothetical protein